MKVVALETGFYGGSLKYKDQVFDVAKGESASWYAPLEVKEKPAKQVKEKPESTDKP